MGDTAGEPRGNFLLFDQELNMLGRWAAKDAPFGYDFWRASQSPGPWLCASLLSHTHAAGTSRAAA